MSDLGPHDLESLDLDLLILGAGGAGLCAALHAADASPSLHIGVVVKGLLGRAGCTRMVQGGYNVALAPEDSAERHFMDTIHGGGWLNDQDLTWTLVTGAQRRIRELENRWGCFFDRNPDGTVHQKAFAGQTFDRTVHKGDLTGIEIVNRLAEQVWARGIRRLEEHRAIALIRSRDGARLAGALMIDMRSGGLVFVQARAVLLGTGGGPTMYKYHTPSGDKTCDGMAMALRAGLTLRDMEMVQFHPTGLIVPNSLMTGALLEEGLRGAGGRLLNGRGERFMQRYDAARNFVRQRAGRDEVGRLASRTNYFRDTFAYEEPLFPEIAFFQRLPQFMAAAREVTGRSVVRPAIVYLNILVPGQELAIHTDVPEFLHGAAGNSVLSHLNKLQKEGVVRQEGERWVLV